MSTFLIRSATTQSSSYPIVLTRLGGPRSRPNPQKKHGIIQMEVDGVSCSWIYKKCGFWKKKSKLQHCATCVYYLCQKL